MTELTLACGAKYVGGVKTGKPDQFGKVTTPMRLKGGEMYIGELWNGNPHKQGRVTYLNGFTFAGQFYGFGLCYADIGVVTDAQNVPLHGHCEAVPYLGFKSFSGFFVNGLREGHGVLTWTNGTTWEGSYTADKMNGAFVKTDEDGGRFESIFADGDEKSSKPAGPAELNAASERRNAAELRRAELQRLVEQECRLHVDALTKLYPTMKSKNQSKISVPDKQVLERLVALLQSDVREKAVELAKLKTDSHETDVQLATQKQENDKLRLATEQEAAKHWETQTELETYKMKAVVLDKQVKELKTEVKTIKVEWENDVGQVRTRMMKVDVENMNLSKVNKDLNKKVREMDKQMQLIMLNVQNTSSQSIIDDLKAQLSNKIETEKQLISAKCWCQKCRNSFLSIDELQAHEPTCDNVLKFICPVCDMSMETLDHLINHLDSHRDRAKSQRLSTQCKKCGNDFNTPLELEQHERVCKVDVQEITQQMTALQQQIAEQVQMVASKNKIVQQLTKQVEQDADKHRLTMEHILLENSQLTTENKCFAAAVKQLTQQYKQPTGQPINLVQAQQQQVEVATLQHRNQQLELELKYIKMQCDYDMLKREVVLKDEISKLKEEIGQQKDEINRLAKDQNKNQVELAKAKSNCHQINACKRCNAHFVDDDDLIEHERHCTKIPCPLCDMKFRQLDQFYQHVGSHMKRDNVSE